MPQTDAEVFAELDATGCFYWGFEPGIPTSKGFSGGWTQVSRNIRGYKEYLVLDTMTLPSGKTLYYGKKEDLNDFLRD